MNLLSQKHFEDNLDKEIFSEILEDLDFIETHFVSREEFEAKNWEYLFETWENKHWKTYDLYLPEDINSLECLNIIYELRNKFNLWEKKFQKLIWDIKWAVLIALNRWNVSEEDLEKLAEENNINSELLGEVKRKSMFAGRNFLREVRKWNKEETDFEKWEKLLKEKLRKEFELSFFRKWIDTLRMWLMTFTLPNLEELKNRKVLEWEKVNIRKIVEDNLDTEERKLREKLKVEEYKEKLQKLREEVKKLEWEQKEEKVREIEKLEFEFASNLLKVLRTDYPYQDFKDNKQNNITWILTSKQTTCLSYSLIWHSFLEELWIKDKVIDSTNHIFLKIFIWQKEYYFDSGTHILFTNDDIISGKDKIREYNWDVEELLYTSFLGNIWWNFDPNKYTDKDIEKFHKILKEALSINPYDLSIKVIYWTILIFLWRINKEKKYFIESIKHFNYVIFKEPHLWAIYLGKSISLEELWYKELSELYYFVDDYMETWKDNIWLSPEKRKIRNFIKQKDFEWLRDYMFSLDEKYWLKLD